MKTEVLSTGYKWHPRWFPINRDTVRYPYFLHPSIPGGGLRLKEDRCTTSTALTNQHSALNTKKMSFCVCVFVIYLMQRRKFRWEKWVFSKDFLDGGKTHGFIGALIHVTGTPLHEDTRNPTRPQDLRYFYIYYMYVMSQLCIHFVFGCSQ